MSSEEKETNVIKKEKTERIIAILSWIVILFIVLYSGLYVGKVERENRSKEKEKKSLSKENITLDSSTDHERYVVRVYGFKNESQTIDFISENLGFKYLKPIQISAGSSERCVDIGYFRSRKSAEQISKKYEEEKRQYQIYNYKDKDVVSFLNTKNSPVQTTSNVSVSDDSSANTEGKTANIDKKSVLSAEKKGSSPGNDKSSVGKAKGTVTEIKNTAVKSHGITKTSQSEVSKHQSSPVDTSKSTAEKSTSVRTTVSNETRVNVKPHRMIKPSVKTSDKKTHGGSSYDKSSTQKINRASGTLKNSDLSLPHSGDSFLIKSHKRVDNPDVLKNMFTIQVLSLTNRNSAEAVLKKLEKAGYHAYLTDNGRSDKRVYRIRVGAFRTRESANSVKDDVVKALKELSGGYVLHGVLKK